MHIKTFIPVILAGAVITSASLAIEKAPPSAKKSPAQNTVQYKHPANLAQLMRGTLFSESNVIFAAQSVNPADIPRAQVPSAATDPLNGVYGGWNAIENISLAMAEMTDLLEVPGRLCSNGRPVPTKNADWSSLVNGLRDASLKSYEAAKSKNQDNIVEASDALTTACSNCHRKYRDTPRLEDRCK
jgi:hypothetical protein